MEFMKKGSKSEKNSQKLQHLPNRKRDKREKCKVNTQYEMRMDQKLRKNFTLRHFEHSGKQKILHIPKGGELQLIYIETIKVIYVFVNIYPSIYVIFNTECHIRRQWNNIFKIMKK